MSINRVYVSPSSVTGQVVVTIAAPGGVVSGGDVTTVDANLVEKCLPDTATLTTQSAVANTIPVSYKTYYHATDGIVVATERANIAAALLAAFNTFPIGGEIISVQGYVFVNLLEAIISRASPLAFQVIVDAPAADVAIALTPIPEVPVLGALTDTGAHGPQVVT